MIRPITFVSLLCVLAGLGAFGRASDSPTKISYSFGRGVSDEDKTALTTEIEAIRVYTRAALGVDITTVDVFADSDPDKLADTYGRWFKLQPDALERVRRRYNNGSFGGEATYRAIFVLTSSPTWRERRGIPYLTVKHEFFHIVQNELMGERLAQAARTTTPDRLRSTGPNWLAEGSADCFGWFADTERPGANPKVFRSSSIQNVQHDSVALQSLEVPAAFQAYNRGYMLGFLACELLTRERGVAALGNYYRLLGRGLAWPAAFEQAFGLTPPDFYSKFETYRANGFSS